MTTALSYNAANQLTTETAGSIVTTHTYDEFGRLARTSSSSETTSYAYDALGKLSGVSGEDMSATYSYGLSGMRERKVVTTDTGTRTTTSVWSGMTLVAESDSDGTTYEYVYGGGVPLELVATTPGGVTTRYAYQTDAAGSVIGITDEDGDVVARYAYDPYGVPLALEGDALATRNPLRYRGYYWDAETSLYYLPARYYEPRSARFTSVDPAPPEAGRPVSINRYSYCFADPVNSYDPSGADPPGKGIHVPGTMSSWVEDGVTTTMIAGESVTQSVFYHALTATGGASGGVSSGRSSAAGQASNDAYLAQHRGIGVISVGTNFSSSIFVFVHTGGSISNFSVDRSGQVAWTPSWVAGVSGPHMGFGPTATLSTAESVRDIAGPSVQFGADASILGEGGVGLGPSYQHIAAWDGSYEGRQAGLNFGVGAAVTPKGEHNVTYVVPICQVPGWAVQPLFDALN